MTDQPIMRGRTLLENVMRQWPSTAIICTLALALALVPLYVQWSGQSYLLILSSRILVYALAAMGLNLALGYGGLVSLGHAMYMGLGAYSVLILPDLGVSNGALELLILAAAVSVIAGLVGSIALRTRAIAFIMITLAFAQLFYYLFISLKAYGGDEGMSIVTPSGFGPLTGNTTALYYSLFASSMACAWGTRRLVQSRFGLVLRAAKENDLRVKSLGTATGYYQLTSYVLSALICALAGFFLANLTGFVSPSYMAWTVSGDMLVMVLLGGVGTVLGPALGALVLLLLEEVAKSWTEHWMILLGLVIVAAVMLMRNGLWSLLNLAAQSLKSSAGAKDSP